MTSNPVLAEALRGDRVESFHRGAFAVVDASGALHSSLGDIDRPIFPRSAVKLLQALPLVESGAADAAGLGDAELALACASHGGEARHAATAAGMLAQVGLDAGVLECGAHWPYHEGSAHALVREGVRPSALHNNCSGKHAGFVCLGCAMHGGDDAAGFLRGYVRPEHPVMREVTASLESATGHDLGGATPGTDGCSIPTWAIPLRALALAFARVATGQGLSPGRAKAAARLRRAIAAAPYLVAGEGRLDTRLMTHFGERLCCKVGAEGVYCAALPELGLGIAIKMDDGNGSRASEVVLAALLQDLWRAEGADAALLEGVWNAPMRNWNGLEVGRLRVAGGWRRPA